MKEGEVADFSCKVIGDPTPDLIWYFNGQQLEGKGRYTVVEKEELQVLEIYDIIPGDEGEYKVTASNPFGSVTCSADLEVQGMARCFKVAKCKMLMMLMVLRCILQICPMLLKLPELNYNINAFHLPLLLINTGMFGLKIESIGYCW